VNIDWQIFFQAKLIAVSYIAVRDRAELERSWAVGL
jgi:hypothetical protein